MDSCATDVVSDDTDLWTGMQVGAGQIFNILYCTEVTGYIMLECIQVLQFAKIMIF